MKKMLRAACKEARTRKMVPVAIDGMPGYTVTAMSFAHRFGEQTRYYVKDASGVCVCENNDVTTLSDVFSRIIARRTV